MKKIYLLTTALPLSFAAMAAPAAAQGENEEDAIVVVGERLRGGVNTSIPALEEIDAEDVEALGVSSLEEIVEAVSPQTTSGRGGRPIFLINGLRISSRREIRDLPPESIRRVQIFPEEVALQYGYRPDQRVINFILKEDFSSFNVAVEYGQPQSGGFSRQEVDGTLTRISEKSRFNIDIEYETGSTLTEDERGIISDDNEIAALAGNITSTNSGAEIDPSLSALTGQNTTIVGTPGTANPSLASFAANPVAADGNIGAFRSLVGSTDRFELNNSWTKILGPQTTFAINANYELEETTSLLGLPSAELLFPASNPASPFANDTIINQSFVNPNTLSQREVTHTANFGAAFNTLIGSWRWSVTGDYNYIENETTTTQNANFTALQAGLVDGSISPFSADFGSDLLFLSPNTSDSTNQLISLRSNLSGTLIEIPSGAVRLTFGQNYSHRSQESESFIAGTQAIVDLSRDTFESTATLDVPIVTRDLGPLGFLGEVSINGNYGIADLSDFGMLQEYGAGIVWSPSDRLSLQATYIVDEAAPDIETIGAPLIVTPNRSFFDFTNNETVLITNISGGNPSLQAQKSRDWKFAATWKPLFLEGLTLQSEYLIGNSNNVTASFPLLSPEIEAAFSDRVVRDASGNLLSVDQTPVNYDSVKTRSLRNGFSLRGNLDKSSQGGRGGPGRSGRAGGQKSGAPKARSRSHGRWSISVFHTWRLRDEILIAPGTPVLDRLNGSSSNFLGGTPEHEIEISGGIFKNGLGFRLRGNYRSGTEVLGTGLADSTDLSFSDRLDIDALFFVSLDKQVNLAKKISAFKNSRVSLRVRNIFNDYVRVTDSDGNRPLSYQRGFVDPEGRYFELNFRKRF